MENVQLTLEGEVLVIKVDLSKTQGPSKSGKSIIIATTAGNAKVPGHDGVLVGLNVYRKA
jgi:hypothetical protein